MTDSHAPEASETEAARDKLQLQAPTAVSAIKTIMRDKAAKALRRIKANKAIMHVTAKLAPHAPEAAETEADRKKQIRALKSVSIIKAVLFVIEAIASIVGHSSSLRANAFDTAQDAASTGASVAVHNHSRRRQAILALVKSGIMAAGALGIVALGILALVNPVSLPATAIMGLIGGVALIGNLASAALLLRHRNDNINMKSSWKAIRNDAASDGGVLLAAGIGLMVITPIPDFIVGLVISAVTLKAARDIARESIHILRAERAKKKKHAEPAPPDDEEPSIALRFRRGLSIIFNRVADIIADPADAPEPMHDAPKPDLSRQKPGHAASPA